MNIIGEKGIKGGSLTMYLSEYSAGSGWNSRENDYNFANSRYYY